MSEVRAQGAGWALARRAALVLGLTAAGAATATAAVTPSEVMVPIGRRIQVAVTWNVSGFTPGYPVQSTQGVFRVLTGQGCTGAVLATVNATLQATADNSGAIAAQETVRVPAAVTVAARKVGANAVCYYRLFQDPFSQSQVAEALRLPLGAGGLGAGQFGLEAVRMRFDDGSVARVVDRGTDLGVHAQLRYHGRGRLRAVWEVADPASTLGTGTYRVVATVHRDLTGRGRIVLQGPRLPTGVPGLYVVRLRILEPAIDAPGLRLRYLVRGGAAARPPETITLRAPGPGTRLGAVDRFTWTPVEDAAVYRLEVHEAFGGGVPDEGARPRAGMLLPASRTAVAPSRLLRRRLARPGAYLWRVVAFDAAGRVVGRSPFRRLLVTEDDRARSGGAASGGG